MKKHTLLLILSFMIILSCKNQTTETVIEDLEKTESTTTEKTSNNDEGSIENKIKSYLTEDYLKDDIDYLQDNDRKFQYHEVDLNHDGENEIFIRFMSSYFCGSGGCTFLLLDSKLNIITHFTVTEAPIFVETTDMNGWSILLVKDAGIFKELSFENGTYPNNPSLLEKAPYDAPSGHALIMFDENYSDEKTIVF